MRKRHVFALVLLGLTAASAVCRVWQRAGAFEPSGLLTPGQVSTGCLVAVWALAGIGCFLLSRWMGRRGAPGSYLAAFALPHKGALAVYLLAGAMLVAGGALAAREFRLGLSDQLGQLALGLGLALCGPAVALVGWLNAQRREGQGRFAWPLLVPGYCGCVWLVALFQARSTQPSVMGYAPYLLGAVCAVSFCCAAAAFAFEKPAVTAALWLGSMAVVLLAAALVDSVLAREWPVALVQGGYLLYAGAQVTCLLTRLEVPAQLEEWTPEPEKSDEVETEVTDHE